MTLLQSVTTNPHLPCQGKLKVNSSVRSKHLVAIGSRPCLSRETNTVEGERGRQI